MTREQVEGLFYIVVLVALIFAIARLRASIVNIDKHIDRNQEKSTKLKIEIERIKND